MVGQLRTYTINKGMMESWLKLFNEELISKIKEAGMGIQTAWVNEENSQFIWIRTFNDKEEIEEKFTKKDFDKNEDANMHSENAVELARQFGSTKEYKRMVAIYKDHMKRGHITSSDQKERDKLVMKYYPKLESVGLDEWTLSDVEAAMRKRHGKVDKEAIEKLRKVMYKGNVDRNDLVKVGHGKLHVESVELDEEEKGLWHNIHKKRERGEKMRKKGDPGAPTDAAIKKSQEDVDLDEELPSHLKKHFDKDGNPVTPQSNKLKGLEGWQNTDGYLNEIQFINKKNKKSIDEILNNRILAFSVEANQKELDFVLDSIDDKELRRGILEISQSNRKQELNIVKQKIIKNFNKLFEENSVVHKLTFDEKISIMKWRASQPSGLAVPLSLQFSRKYKIGFCGDWFEGDGFGRIEGSILSALILEKKIKDLIK